MYCTIALVRELSGLDNSTNVTDSVVKGKIAQSTNMIDGAIGYYYQLPLAFHRQNTITLEGTGSGSGTMTITVNGTDYDVSRSNGDTADVIADKFREVVLADDTNDFITDVVGSGAIVELISTSDSTAFSTANAEVNVTAITGSDGFTTTIGTRSNRYSPYIQYLCADLATAMLLQDIYGIEAQGTPRDGFQRMEGLNAQLAQLQGTQGEGIARKRLFDEVTGSELALSTKDNPVFYPNNISNVNATDPTAPQVTMNTKY